MTGVRTGLRALIALFIWRALSGCVEPYRVQTTVSPSLQPCRYKTYSFLPPEDQTRTHWLSDPKHRQALEDIVRESMTAHGLAEAPAAASAPDLWVRQSLTTTFNAATQTTEGVVMANDYKLAKWKVELADGQTNPAVWAAQLNAVIGDLERQNLSNARNGLRNAFSDYPACTASGAAK